jgi:hypothetical protein
VLTDRATARILAAIVLVMSVIIDVSCFVFTKAEVRAQPSFPIVVLVASLPLFLLSFWLFWRASKLKVEED